jgi:1-deoxy-D-xylulose-5-phosphate synthase
VGVIDPLTGQPVTQAKPTWTSVFGSEMVAIGQERRDVVGVTAAMLAPVGLTAFAEAFPKRVFDVGIAEQHATTSAAGMAFAGLHPVVAIYATFLNRAFDQVLMDCALHKAGVTFVLDRAGVTGPDGPSHHGMWDMAILQVVPGLRLAAPRDGATLREELREAVAVDDAPTVLRFPTGPVPADLPALDRRGGVDVLHRSGETDVLVVAVGVMTHLAIEVAQRLADQGIGVTVVDPRWVKPLPDEVLAQAARHRLVVTIEDGVRVGGIGSVVAQGVRDSAVRTPLLDFGLPTQFLEHGRRPELMEDLGLTAQDISRRVVEAVAGIDAPLADAPTDA